MERADTTFVCRASHEESSEVKLLIGRCKEAYNERTIEVIIKALKHYKNFTLERELK